MSSFIIMLFSQYKWNDEGYWHENQKKRDRWEYQDVGGRIILKWILER
jgi:hypothetical protein